MIDQSIQHAASMKSVDSHPAIRFRSQRGGPDGPAGLSGPPSFAHRSASRQDPLPDHRVQVEHAAAMPRRRIEIGLDRVVVLALGVQEDELGDLPLPRKSSSESS